MAIYHFSGTVISRSQGRSVVACAAYRAGETLRDNYYQKTHDYQYKKDVAFTEILLPNGAPLWMKDRGKLWNFVEANEKRRDAQLAREFNMALPKELTLEQNIALAKSFVQQQFVEKGMVVDLAVHNDLMPNGEHQPHAHVMLTLREVTSEGFGLKNRDWNRKELLIEWREAWANSVNQALFQYGFDLSVDHRTLEAQNIPLEPQHKIGPNQARDQMTRLADHQRIARENGLKLLNEPEIVLHALTQQQSTFTKYDIARFINRHSVDTEQFSQILPKVMASSELISLGLDAKNQKRFTTQTMLNLERTMLGQAERLAQDLAYPIHEPIHESQSVSESFQSVSQSLISLTQEQTSVLKDLLSPQRINCVIGYAGTGKSYLLGEARKVWEASGYQVKGAALSGIAADGLSGSSGIPSRTIASYLHQWTRGEMLSSKEIFVLDEAGMVGSRQMARILDKVYQSGAKLVLVGDPEQLQSIEAGASFRALSERIGFTSLTEIKRQTHPWQQMATKEFATGQTAKAIERYERNHQVHAFVTQAEAQRSLIDLWYDTKINHPDQSQIILAYTRDEVKTLNLLARSVRAQNHELGESHSVQTAQGARLFAIQERIYFLKNDYDLGVRNGTLGTIESMDKDWLTIRLDSVRSASTDIVKQGDSPDTVKQSDSITKKGTLVRLNIKHYPYLDYGYAATVHKAQGVTVDNAYLLVSQYLDRHSTYVAASRHRNRFNVFWSEETFKNKNAMINSLSRARHKDVTLDYRSFAARRDIYSSEKDLSQQQVVSETSSDLSLADKKRYEQLFREGLKEMRSHAAPSQSIESFNAQYEKLNPTEAKKIQEQIKALGPTTQSIHPYTQQVEKMFYQLVKAYKEQPSAKTQTALMSYAFKLNQQTVLMDDLKKHHSTLSVKIEQLAKTHERQLARDLDEKEL